MESFYDTVDVLSLIVSALQGVPPFYAALLKEMPGQVPGADTIPKGVLYRKHIRPPIRAEPGREL